MPGCAAVGCTNSAKKGFVMKKFPKDLARRREWLVKMKRDNWKPTDNSCLCEVHFASEMWEKTRVDGTRKLRCNAVPTIFFFTLSTTKKGRKPPTVRSERKAAAKNVTGVTEKDFEISVTEHKQRLVYVRCLCEALAEARQTAPRETRGEGVEPVH